MHKIIFLFVSLISFASNFYELPSVSLLGCNAVYLRSEVVEKRGKYDPKTGYITYGISYATNHIYSLNFSIQVNDDFSDKTGYGLLLQIVSNNKVVAEINIADDISKLRKGEIYSYNFEIPLSGSGWKVVDLVGLTPEQEEIIYNETKVYISKPPVKTKRRNKGSK